MESIDKNQAIRIIRSGKFFSCEFIKRTDGSLRKMNARTGVKKHLNGGSSSYDFNSKGLIPVYDLEKKGYRSIPLESLNKLNGKIIKDGS